MMFPGRFFGRCACLAAGVFFVVSAYSAPQAEFSSSAAEKIGGDMVVVPLSIHEVVCLPADKADPDIIHDMLMESIMEREQEDSQENVLSSTIYYYDSVRKHISILVSGGDMVQ